MEDVNTISIEFYPKFKCRCYDSYLFSDIKCLQMVLIDENKELDEECKSHLTKRMEMFKSAAVVIITCFFQMFINRV